MESLQEAESKDFKIKCQCGFKGTGHDLIAPDDDEEPIPCPRCGQPTWEFV